MDRVYGRAVIAAYRRGDIDTHAFCEQYLALYAYDEGDALELAYNNSLFDACVIYLDQLENAVVAEQEIERLTKHPPEA